MATDAITVARYAPGDNEPEYEESFTIAWMEKNLPVMGDGTTHYYLQGPVFDESEDPWNPDEEINCYPDKDMGALRGTDVAALCDLAGGAHRGDVILIRSEDGFRKSFPYANVYTPPSRQGPMVLAWERDGQKAGAGYYDGMRLQFFADTSVNPWGEHIFGNSDMQSALPEEYWHFFQPNLPTTTGLSVQSVSRIEIYESSGGQPPVVPSGGSDGGADIWAPATGTLTVRSVPEGAAVVIDGAVSEFVTNVSIPDMPEGYYGVTVQREGYENPAEEWILVADGSNATVSFAPTAITASCTVVSHPAGAAVAVDGVNSGMSAGTEPLTLITGNHVLTLTMEGYVPLDLPVCITKEGENRVEGVLVPLCSEDDTPVLSAGPHGLLPGSLMVAAAPGYPGFISGGESVRADLPDADGEEITSYLLFSHGSDTTSGLPAEPQVALSSGGAGLIPRHLANALSSAGSVDQTCALFPSVSRAVTVRGAGGEGDVFSLCAAVSLLARPGPGEFSYVVYEGCVPAEGEVLTIPADTLPENGTRTLTLLCSGAGEKTDAPVISVNGMPLRADVSLPVPGLLRMSVPLPPGDGAYTVTAAGASPGCMVRIAVATAAAPSGAVSDGTETAETADASGDADGGVFAGIFRFFAALFSSSAPELPAPGDDTSLPVAGSLPDATPLPDTPAPEMTAAPAAPAEVDKYSALTGGVLVESVPSGAWISLDGKPTGRKTPALFAGLKEGTHRIGVSSALTGGSRSDTAWVYPGALGSIFFDFSGSLPETAVQVESGTDEPVVFTVNGKLPKQTTPAEVTIVDTDSFVAVTSDTGYQTYPLGYRRGDGTLSVVPATSGTCTVAVASDPAGAEIFIDGRRTGETTPSAISGLSTGPHRVACSLPGYRPEARVVSINDLPGTTDAEAAFTLLAYSNGGLCVTSEPAGAKIYLYDRYIGLVTPATIPGLPIGTYEIGLSSEDETMIREATVLPDTVVTYEFRFETE
ncbi:PEGA domain-containing protein [Methanogenium sp. MK-MG]|uniref:PEGA domain-containing protein n=1 Tax=Methanogenium sp. MK-MG TaxID=2599926 RepID=UPI0013EA922D|nr:PEGA domain-containing protein [Methanogenium sp. MK-MG]